MTRRTAAPLRNRAPAWLPPAPYRRLVVAVFPGQRPRGLIRRALALPLADGARIDIVSVIPAAVELDTEDVKRWENVLVAELTRLEPLIERRGAKVSARVVRAKKKVGASLIEAAGTADLLLLDPPRKGPLARECAPTRIASEAKMDVLVAHGKRGPPYQRVIIGTDFSAASRTIFDHGRRSAPDAERTVLVHVEDSAYALVLRQMSTHSDRVVAYEASQREQAEAKLSKFAVALPAVEGLETEVVVGNPETALTDRARRLGADLVVLGSRGTPDAYPRLGGVAHALLKEAPCDVLVCSSADAPTKK